MSTWGIFHGGILSAAENLAWDRVLLKARAEGRIGNVLFFSRFAPCALVGRHQSLTQELDLAYCAAHGIEVQRRITGGGAIYLDPAQLGWELFADRRALGAADMDAIARRVCEAAAQGLRVLGVDARFRPRNDIEVGGRKISGTGGAVDGAALLYQGTLLMDFDAAAMLRVLRVSATKLEAKAVASVAERVTSLKALLPQAPELATVKAVLTEAFARAFGVRFQPWQPPPELLARHAAAVEAMRQPDWLQAVGAPPDDMPLAHAGKKFAGGEVRVALAYDRRRKRLREVCFSGDFFVYPARRLADLEAALRGASVEEARQHLRALPAEGFSVAPEELAQLFAEALAKAEHP
jgi:lipoate-protein ligase A